MFTLWSGRKVTLQEARGLLAAAVQRCFAPGSRSLSLFAIVLSSAPPVQNSSKLSLGKTKSLLLPCGSHSYILEDSLASQPSRGHRSHWRWSLLRSSFLRFRFFTFFLRFPKPQSRYAVDQATATGLETDGGLVAKGERLSAPDLLLTASSFEHP